MKWEQTYQKIDSVVGKKQEIEFIPDGEIPEIAFMSSSCGCSKPRLEDNKIIATFTPGSIPMHLKQYGMYKTTKKITITYKDNSQDLLSFTAIIKR